MITMPARQDIRGFVLVAGLVILADVVTKRVMLALIFDPPRVIELLPILNFAPAWNRGVSFGFLAQGGEVTRYSISLLALIVCLWLFFQLPQLLRMQKWGAGLIAGGAIGNVIDRQIYGKVVDFIDFHLGTWHYPSFNIADAAISCGVGIWMISLIKEAHLQKQNQKGKS